MHAEQAKISHNYRLYIYTYMQYTFLRIYKYSTLPTVYVYIHAHMYSSGMQAVLYVACCDMLENRNQESISHAYIYMQLSTSDI